MAQKEVLDHRGLSVSPGKGINWLGDGPIRSPQKHGKFSGNFEKGPDPSQAHDNITQLHKEAVSLSLTREHVLPLFVHMALAAARTPNTGSR